MTNINPIPDPAIKKCVFVLCYALVKNGTPKPMTGTYFARRGEGSRIWYWVRKLEHAFIFDAKDGATQTECVTQLPQPPTGTLMGFVEIPQ